MVRTCAFRWHVCMCRWERCTSQFTRSTKKGVGSASGTGLVHKIRNGFSDKSLFSSKVHHNIPLCKFLLGNNNCNWHLTFSGKSRGKYVTFRHRWWFSSQQGEFHMEGSDENWYWIRSTADWVIWVDYGQLLHHWLTGLSSCAFVGTARFGVWSWLNMVW